MSATRDEIHDRPEDLEGAGPLAQFLRLCEAKLQRPFREADRAALAHQKRYRHLTGWAAVIGGVALVLAATNIAFHPRDSGGAFRTSLGLEALFAAGASALVLIGLLALWHEKWLLARYKAEQFRLLKFRYLVDPSFWSQGGAASEGRFVHEIQRIEALEYESLAAAAEHEDVPLLASDVHCDRIDEGLKRSVLDYYRRKRLEFQIDYFARKAKKESRHWYQNPRWLPFLFFTSVVLVVVHALIESAGEPASSLGSAGRIALALSLGIPAFWSAVRTWRSANEFGRNSSRSLAKLAALSRVADRLAPEAPTPDVFSDMGLCEYILSCDQAEWLRLMRDAEWYG